LTVSNGGDLLRMLMPAVSPVPTQNAPRPASKLPIESQSFDALLAEARQTEPMTQPQDTAEAVAPNEETEKANTENTLPGLTGIGSIHNASLLRIVSGDV
jgi:hypothetical protein